jgi:hypothetical protein
MIAGSGKNGPSALRGIGTSDGILEDGVNGLESRNHGGVSGP